MLILSAVSGEFYEQSFQALQERLAESVCKVSPKSVNVEHPCSRIKGLMTKVSAYKRIPRDYQGPVLIIDSDMVPTAPNVLENLPRGIATDLAAVSYPEYENIHYPDSEVQHVADSGVPKINSGFLLFRDGSIARKIGKLWEETYLRKLRQNYVHHNFVNDEFSLYITIYQLKATVTLLPKVWNNYPERGQFTDEDTAYFNHNTSDGTIRK